MSMKPIEQLGERAAATIERDMLVGLGSGSTAEAMVAALGKRVADGFICTGVPTSKRTADLCNEYQIPIASLDDIDTLDLCIDGADEIDPQLNVVKGRGGALLWEKLVARRATRYIIIASHEKLVDRLGTRLPLPVEVIPFGWNHTSDALAELGLRSSLRLQPDGSPVRTDGQHFILDCEIADGIEDAVELGTSIKLVTGVVDHGLFTNMVDLAMTIDDTGTITEHSKLS